MKWSSKITGHAVQGLALGPVCLSGSLNYPTALSVRIAEGNAQTADELWQCQLRASSLQEASLHVVGKLISAFPIVYVGVCTLNSLTGSPLINEANKVLGFHFMFA